jgi:hypothetical protein
MLQHLLLKQYQGLDLFLQSRMDTRLVYQIMPLRWLLGVGSLLAAQIIED